MINAVDFDDFDENSSFFQPASATSQLHEAIYSQENALRSFTRTVTLQSSEDSKVETVSRRSREGGRRDRRAEADVETGIKGSFGGGKGVQIEGYLQGEVRSNNGGYVRGSVSGNKDGAGEFDASAGYRGKIGPKT